MIDAYFLEWDVRDEFEECKQCNCWPGCRPDGRLFHDHECVRCNESFAVDEFGYCTHCHWYLRAEVDEGFYQLLDYLRAWTRFDEWCKDHGQTAL